MGQLVAVHVLGGALSLSKGRTLFPRPPLAAAPAHSSGMISVQQAVQLLIEVQQTTQLKRSTSASSDCCHSAAESAVDVAAPPQLGAVSSSTASAAPTPVVAAAAKQMLQTLATQHSCKCQPVYSPTLVQLLLQPCLSAFCQPQAARPHDSTPAAKGWAPAAKGSAPSAESCAHGAKGSIAAIRGSPAAVKGGPLAVKGSGSDVKGSTLPLADTAEGQWLPIDLEMLHGCSDAADMACHDWQTLR